MTLATPLCPGVVGLFLRALPGRVEEPGSADGGTDGDVGRGAGKIEEANRTIGLERVARVYALVPSGFFGDVRAREKGGETGVVRPGRVADHDQTRRVDGELMQEEGAGLARDSGRDGIHEPRVGQVTGAEGAKACSEGEFGGGWAAFADQSAGPETGVAGAAEESQLGAAGGLGVGSHVSIDRASGGQDWLASGADELGAAVGPLGNKAMGRELLFVVGEISLKADVDLPKVGRADGAFGAVLRGIERRKREGQEHRDDGDAD